MTAYLIADVDVHDPAVYREYTQLVPATLAPFGGEFLVRGGSLEGVEGDWEPGRLVVIRFPSIEQARAWYTSPDYAAAMTLRHRAADARIILVEGA